MPDKLIPVSKEAFEAIRDGIARALCFRARATAHAMQVIPEWCRVRIIEDGVVVPRVPTEEQWGGLARDIMMWLDMATWKTPATLFEHLGHLDTEIPQWLIDEPEMRNVDYVISKGTCVSIIYRAMLAAAQEWK